jgi:septation ring formation regulator EzrA
MRISDDVLGELTESASKARTHLQKLDQQMRQLERLLESESAASRREYQEDHDQGQKRVKGVLAAVMELRVNLAHVHRNVRRTPGRAQHYKGAVNHIGDIAKGVGRLLQARNRYINGGGASQRRRGQ